MELWYSVGVLAQSVRNLLENLPERRACCPPAWDKIWKRRVIFERSKTWFQNIQSCFVYSCVKVWCFWIGYRCAIRNHTLETRAKALNNGLPIICRLCHENQRLAKFSESLKEEKPHWGTMDLPQSGKHRQAGFERLTETQRREVVVTKHQKKKGHTIWSALN